MTSDRTKPKSPTAVTIDFLTLADQGSQVQGKLYLLGAGFSVQHAKSYPAPLQFVIAAGVSVPSESAGTEHEMFLAIKERGGPLLVEAAGKFRVNQPVKGLILPQRANLVLDFALAIPHPGVYEVSARIGRTRKSTYFQSIPSER